MEERKSIRIVPGDWIHPLPVQSHFDSPLPLEVDIGCGKGRFLVAHAKANPGINLLGIERMLERVRKIDNRVQRLQLPNIRLLRIEAYYAITYLMPPSSVRTYYLFFPDPWPKTRHHNHRLFNPAFMDALHRTMESGACLHVATDHLPYFEEIAALLRADTRFEECEPFIPGPEARTDFECWYLDRTPIGRCSVRRL